MIDWINARGHHAKKIVEQHFYAAAKKFAGSDEALSRAWQRHAQEYVKDPCSQWNEIHAQGLNAVRSHTIQGVMPSEVLHATFVWKG